MKKLAISIRNYNKENYKEIINNVEKVGFKNVFIEWYNDDFELQQSILSYIHEVGLNIICAHLGYQKANLLWADTEEAKCEEERYINDIKTCKENGIDLVVMHPTYEYKNVVMNEVGLARIKRIVDVAKENNVRVAFENVELVEYLEYIIRNIESSNLGVCFDVGHCNLFCDGNINVDLFKNRVFLIHLHDNFKETDDHNLPFDGNVDWEKAISQIITMDYNDYIVIESGYDDYYSNFSLAEYYKIAYDRGLKLIELFEMYKEKYVEEKVD